MVTTALPLSSTSNGVISFLQFLYYTLEGIVLCFVPQSWRQKKNVSGQTVLITGAGSGIGQLMAIKFAQLKCRLILWDINLPGLETTLNMIRDEKLNVDNCFIYKINLANRDEIYATAKMVQKDVAPVDMLINNAGIVSGNYFLDIPDNKIKLTFDVNTVAHFYTIKAFLPSMIERNRGHIVTVSSGLGNVSVCKLADYCASKFANVGMDLALRMELGQAGLENMIQTTIVKPSMITTGMFAGGKSLMLPPLSPEYVVDKIVTGILTNAHEVILPYSMVFFFYLVAMLPSKALLPLIDFSGAFDAMTHFVGRGPVVDNNNNNKSEVK